MTDLSRYATFPPEVLDKPVREILGQICLACGREITESSKVETEVGTSFFDLICQTCADNSHKQAIRIVENYFASKAIRPAEGKKIN